MTAALGGEGDGAWSPEVADLWFHTMVLLGARGISLRRVFEELGLAGTPRVRELPVTRASRSLAFLAGCCHPPPAASRTGSTTPPRGTG